MNKPKTTDFESDPDLVPTSSSLGVEDTSIEPVEPVAEEKEEEEREEKEESEYDANEERENQSPYFTGYDRMDLDLTPQIPLTINKQSPLSVHLCLYRIQTKENNPYLEFVLQKHASNQQYYLPSFEIDSLTFGSEGTALKNNLLTHIEVLLGKTSTDYPVFHGFETYQDKVIAFYNLTDYAVDMDSTSYAVGTSSTGSTSSTGTNIDWFLVNELVNPPTLDPFVVEFFKEHPFIRTLYTIENNQEVEFPTPLIVYHSSPSPTRQVDPTFGYVYKLIETASVEGGFTYPYILFPPPLDRTFFLLKKEFQEIAVESLVPYHDAFISNECIRYVEKGATVWIVKDVLAFYRREPDTTTAATETVAAAATAATAAATTSFFPTKTTTSSLTNPHIRTESTRSKTPSSQLLKSTYPTESTYDYDAHPSRLLNPGKNRSFQGIK